MKWSVWYWDREIVVWVLLCSFVLMYIVIVFFLFLLGSYKFNVFMMYFVLGLWIFYGKEGLVEIDCILEVFFIFFGGISKVGKF